MKVRTLLTLFPLIAIVFVCGGITFLKWTGLRASSTPSAMESRTAAVLRKFATPASQRRLKNPVGSDAMAVEYGREVFLSRCATCHGIDGYGSTAVGRGSYPRVPDLHSRATQQLSDGEIHYIVLNGVRFSGMPSSQFNSPDDSWYLVAYIRTLGSDALAMRQSEHASSAHYVGSIACKRCHADIYNRWSRTPMANIVLDPKTHPDAVLGDIKTNRVAPFSLSQVAFVYGSKWKQRFFVRKGDDYYPLPVQWDVSTRKWLPYHVPDKGADWWAALYPSDNAKRPTGPTCDGCHSVNYDIQTHQVEEWNVGCERCHGPGSEHVAHPSSSNILNPAVMDAVAANDVCIQCHSQGRPAAGLINGKAYDWPVGYNVGLRLADYWKLDSPELGKTDFLHFPEGTAHKNRMQGNDFVQSVMYRHGITCASCHDVHGTDNYAQLRKPAATLCLDCHGPMSPNGPHTGTIEQHTHHKAGSAGSECIACHMPKIESEGVPGASVTAHTFRFISPAMTERYGVPNPCTTCHKDKSTTWARTVLLKWNSASPWRVAE